MPAKATKNTDHSSLETDLVIRLHKVAMTRFDVVDLVAAMIDRHNELERIDDSFRELVDVKGVAFDPDLYTKIKNEFARWLSEAKQIDPLISSLKNIGHDVERSEEFRTCIDLATTFLNQDEACC